jgi:hypothetical protein
VNIAARLEGIATRQHLHLVFCLRSCPGQSWR